MLQPEFRDEAGVRKIEKGSHSPSHLDIPAGSRDRFHENCERGRIVFRKMARQSASNRPPPVHELEVVIIGENILQKLPRPEVRPDCLDLPCDHARYPRVEMVFQRFGHCAFECDY